MGAAWVAIALHLASYPAVFALTAVMVGLGLLASFCGADPP